MREKVILIGAGENSRVIAATLQATYEIVGFLDDHLKSKAILGTVNSWRDYAKDHHFFITIGGNRERQRMFSELQEAGAHFVNAIHTSAVVEKSVKVGTNVFIGALTYINIGTTIGSDSFINNGCIVEHDNHIAGHCHLAPGVITGGGVSVGEGAFIGLGARVNDHLSIGSETIVGSGAVVTVDLPSHVTAVGIPAKIIKANSL